MSRLLGYYRLRVMGAEGEALSVIDDEALADAVNDIEDVLNVSLPEGFYVKAEGPFNADGSRSTGLATEETCAPDSDMSLRARPGESPQDVIERVTKAAKEAGDGDST